MPICLNLNDIVRQVGFRITDNPATAISGKLVVPLILEHKQCQIRTALTITFNHQNIITLATFEIQEILYDFIEELALEGFDREIRKMLKELCEALGQSGQLID